MEPYFVETLQKTKLKFLKPLEKVDSQQRVREGCQRAKEQNVCHMEGKADLCIWD